MNRNLIIIGAVVGVAVIAGGAYFALSGGDSSTNNSNTDSSTQSAAEEVDAAAFNPANTLQQDFKATVTTEGENLNTTASAEFDSEAKAWKYSAVTEGNTAEFIVTEDSYYTQMNGTWVKLPTSGDAATGFDRGAYEVTPEELTAFQDVLVYKGDASCPAGTCDLWEVENYLGNKKLSFYITKDTNRINKMVSETDKATITNTYNYEDVTIDIPTDAQELPSFGQ